jgi:hypothetical protein
METTADLRLILSRELNTEDLSLEHDTVVVDPDFSRRIVEALHCNGDGATLIHFPVPAGS